MGIDLSDSASHFKGDGKWTERLQGHKVVLHFGYLVRRKGIEYLIEAFEQVAKKHPDYVLVLAGGELPSQRGYVGDLKKMIVEKDLVRNVVLAGFVSVEEMHELFDICQFAVFPYVYSISSSLPLSLAIGHSKPIIATDIGAFHEELSNGEDSLLVPPRDSPALQHAMETLIEDERIRRGLLTGIKVKAAERPWVSVAQRTCKLYLDLLEKKQND